MAGSRKILHSDLNSFYASVEIMLNPELRGKAVAVCGSVENRHGIVLAKSELAKKAGVKTGMANWQARQACQGLIVLPPQYEQYVKTQGSHGRYTSGSPTGSSPLAWTNAGLTCLAVDVVMDWKLQR